MISTQLKDRQIIELSGKDIFQFLQGLLTNDICQIKDNILQYSVMLNARGRFLYDFFIFLSDNKIFIDCRSDKIDEIIAKLSIYKLKSEVLITKNEKMKVFFSQNKIKADFIFNDPRSSNMGYRIYNNNDLDINSDISFYHKIRINNKIAEGSWDLTCEKSLILEFAFDKLNAINFEKGCYMGQELTARTYHMGEIRKKIFIANISNISQILSSNEIDALSNSADFLKNNQILYNNEEVGIILSAIIDNNNLLALLLLKYDDDILNKDLKFRDHLIEIN
ncbi:MAG: hypothetical protein CMP18_01890 [Rickettsiales bacterium]|nr:hypothetical protein [Rickettsiales bacterium]